METWRGLSPAVSEFQRNACWDRQITHHSVPNPANPAATVKGGLITAALSAMASIGLSGADLLTAIPSIAPRGHDPGDEWGDLSPM